jgi:hypothetical protein
VFVNGKPFQPSGMQHSSILGIRKLQRKLSVVNTVPGVHLYFFVLTITNFGLSKQYC